MASLDSEIRQILTRLVRGGKRPFGEGHNQDVIGELQLLMEIFPTEVHKVALGLLDELTRQTRNQLTETLLRPILFDLADRRSGDRFDLGQLLNESLLEFISSTGCNVDQGSVVETVLQTYGSSSTTTADLSAVARCVALALDDVTVARMAESYANWDCSRYTKRLIESRLEWQDESAPGEVELWSMVHPPLVDREARGVTSFDWMQMLGWITWVQQNLPHSGDGDCDREQRILRSLERLSLDISEYVRLPVSERERVIASSQTAGNHMESQSIGVPGWINLCIAHRTLEPHPEQDSYVWLLTLVALKELNTEHLGYSYEDLVGIITHRKKKDQLIPLNPDPIRTAVGSHQALPLQLAAELKRLASL